MVTDYPYHSCSDVALCVIARYAVLSVFFFFFSFFSLVCCGHRLLCVFSRYVVLSVFSRCGVVTDHQ